MRPGAPPSEAGSGWWSGLRAQALSVPGPLRSPAEVFFFPAGFPALCLLSSDLTVLTVNPMQAFMPPAPLGSELPSPELCPAHSHEPQGTRGPGAGGLRACPVRPGWVRSPSGGRGDAGIGECSGSARRGSGLGWGTAREEDLFMEHALGPGYSGTSGHAAPRPS